MFVDGWQTNDTSTVKTLVKVRTKNPQDLQALYYVVAIAALAMLFVATASALLAHCYIVAKKARNNNLLGVRAFTRNELYRATNGFSDQVGEGGFGKVYRGTVGSAEVAVKILVKADEQYREEFENEIQSIGRIHHRNLVPMVGYCKEGVHRMLVFEYMKEGTLDDMLFDSSRTQPAWSWLDIAKAAVGIARGLEYLHNGCASQILHCDIKPDNILLDQNLSPRITDFGIAKLLGEDKVKKTITEVRGTRGYLAPEWLHTIEGKVDSKVDVYSFGVVLLEMICRMKYPPAEQDELRRRSHDDEPNQGVAAAVTATMTLKDWAADLIRGGNTERLVQGDTDALEDLQRVERFACTAIWCVQVDPSMRPTMRQVVQMLEGTMEVPPIPPRTAPDFSALHSGSNSNSNSSYHTGGSRIE